MTRRRVSAHDLKRRLIRKMANLSPWAVTGIVRELREYAIAKEFMAGRSIDALESDTTLGEHVWSRGDIEQSIRNKGKAAGR